MFTQEGIETLNRIGYNPILSPSTDISPLVLTEREGDVLTALGAISEFAINSATPPQIKANQPSVNLSGAKVGKIDAKAGVNFLDVVLKFFGAGSLGVDLGYKKAEKIEFEFGNVKKDSVTPVELSKYLKELKPDLNNDFYDEIDEEGKSFVIFDVLKSNTISVVAYDGNNKKLDLDTDAIKSVLGLEIEVKSDSKETEKIYYQGSDYLSFAFKAIPVWVEVVNNTPYFRVKLPSDTDDDLIIKSVTPLEAKDKELLSFYFSTVIERNTVFNVKQKSR